MEPRALHTLQALTLGEPCPGLGSPFHCKDPSQLHHRFPFNSKLHSCPCHQTGPSLLQTLSSGWSLRLETPKNSWIHQGNHVRLSKKKTQLEGWGEVCMELYTKPAWDPALHPSTKPNKRMCVACTWVWLYVCEPDTDNGLPLLLSTFSP